MASSASAFHWVLGVASPSSADWSIFWYESVFIVRAFIWSQIPDKATMPVISSQHFPDIHYRKYFYQSHLVAVFKSITCYFFWQTSKLELKRIYCSRRNNILTSNQYTCFLKVTLFCPLIKKLVQYRLDIHFITISFISSQPFT